MDYEKKYKEALERARKLYDSSEYVCEMDGYATIFPELAVSEDERMKKAITHILYENYTDAAVIEGVEIAEIVTWLEKQVEPQPYRGNADTMRKNLIKAFKSVSSNHWRGFGVKDIIYFLESKDAIELEKQGEQKPAWSDEDEQHCRYIIDFYLQKSYGATALTIEWLENLKYRVGLQQKQEWSEEDKKQLERAIYMMEQLNMTKSWDDVYNWLKSLKDRLQPQPKQEWSEEDEIMINDIILDIQYTNGSCERNIISDKKIAWLKSLKPQPHWKPTDEQMDELEKFIVWADELYDENSIRTIELLYNDLKKL